MVYFALGMQLTRNLGFDSRQPKRRLHFGKDLFPLQSSFIASLLTFVSVLALALKTFFLAFMIALRNFLTLSARHVGFPTVFSVFFGSSLHACHGTVNNRLISLKSALLVCPLSQLSGEKN